MKIKLLLLLFAINAAGHGKSDDMMSRILDSIWNDDVVLENNPNWTTISGDYPGFVSSLAVADDQGVIDQLQSVVTNLANTAAIVTNKIDRLRLSTAMMLLGRYDLTNSLPVFASVVTNGICDKLVSEPAFYMGHALGPANHVRQTLISSAWRSLPGARQAEAYEGMFRGLNSRISTISETNRVVSMAMTCLDQSLAWQQADDEVCYLWPAYATSSNRYVAAQRALQADPPCASSNYLARVIAELEALPPGTMQMLSTNHLGQAWGE